ncbi:YIP1 family protein [Sporosarcina highlanderae]|uniref:YIP1 family protein n=1 Tax=Sporosarcina highlanderae TaxID=3035916 RepID=A0ABT8JTU4_9BACL|nr:YIP1 family protein [Sporosarcina highlanderae]MDN4608412.1 YIP1 family protein [Sporosarcina highlanderae]
MNPLLSIWSQPTKTLEYLLEKKSVGYGVFIFLLGSISTGSIALAPTGWFSGLPAYLIVIFSIILTFFGALLGWMIIAALYTWIGKWLGGTGKFSEMIHITPASTILTIWLAPMNYSILAIYGSRLFEVPTENFGVTNLPLGVYFLMNIVTIGVGIYGIVIMSKGIGLVHKFSALRGFGVVAILMGIGMVLAIIFSIIIGILIFSLFTTIG